MCSSDLLYQDFDIAYDACRHALSKGLAFPYFKRMIEDQGGESDVLMNMSEYFATESVQLKAKASGYIHQIEALKVGQAAMLLGAGRQKKEDQIDYYVGLELHKKVGDYVKAGDDLLTIYHHQKGLSDALKLLEEAYHLSEEVKDVQYIIDTVQ